MPIQRQTFRGKEVITVEGKIDQVWINEIPADKIKSYRNPVKNTIWTPTHRYSIVVDGIRINLGMGDKDGVSDRQHLQAKDNDGKYHTIARGLEVSVEVEEGEYNGAPQYSGSLSKTVVLDASGVVQAVVSGAPNKAGTPTAQPFKPKDTSGIRTGHSVNGAFAYFLSNGIDFDYEPDGATVRIAKIVNDVTETVIAAYKAKNPSMSEYDVGAAAGHAVLNACRIIPETDESEFADLLTTTANAILYNIIPAVTEYVKKGQETKPAKASPPAAKKAVSKAKPVVKAPPREEEVVEDPLGGDPEFEDAPF